MHKSEQSINPEEIQNLLLASLWKRYRFPDKPPTAGTIANQRLYDTCKRYVVMIKTRQSKRDILPEERDPENYHSLDTNKTLPIKQDEISDHEQRELHNQIAIMIFGQSRSSMKEELAMKINRFAHEFVGDISSED